MLAAILSEIVGSRILGCVKEGRKNPKKHLCALQNLFRGEGGGQNTRWKKFLGRRGGRGTTTTMMKMRPVNDRAKLERFNHETGKS